MRVYAGTRGPGYGYPVSGTQYPGTRVPRVPGYPGYTGYPLEFDSVIGIPMHTVTRYFGSPGTSPGTRVPGPGYPWYPVPTRGTRRSSQ
eukprot:2398205-Rhodomonas_salina.1